MSIETSFQYAVVDTLEYAALNDPFAAATVVGVAPSGNALIDAVVAGYGRWSGQVTYSFPTDGSAYNGSYAAAIDGLVQVSATQMNAVRGILEGTGNIYGSVEAFCGLDLAQVADNTGRANVNLQIAQCDNFGGSNLPTARVGDFPGSPVYPGFPDAAGDVWFGDDSGTGNDDGGQVFRNPVIGNYAWMTHIHELGHALGLQHSHDAVAGSFGAALPADRRDIEFSVMSYLSFIGATPGYTNEQFGFPQTFMMYDILALQYLYGADYSTNSGNTVYRWSPTTGQMFVDGVGQGLPGANRIFLTIWDGNGNDTYDMSNYSTAVSIDLRPEMWSVTSTAQLADLDVRTSDSSRVARGNVYNAALFNGDARSVIENAIGGSGNDTLIANDFGCTLTGGGGNDILTGGAGIDRLVGGTGVDTMNGGGGADTFVFSFGDSSAASGQHDRINGFVAGVDRIDVSAIDAIAATGARDQFRFVGVIDGSAGLLSYYYDSVNGVTVVQGFTNADRIADFSIDLVGNIVLSAADFIGIFTGPPPVVIEAFGSTQLTQSGSNYYLSSGGSSPSIKYGGTAIFQGQFGNWTPIGAEQTANGYTVVLKLGTTDQYTIWSTDSSGNYLSNSVVVAGSDSMLTSLESSFHQDLNGNGIIGASGTMIEALGSTLLAKIANHYYLNHDGSGPSLKYAGAAVVPGQFGNWTPIGAEQTANGYTVVLKLGTTDQYTIWSTDSSGNYLSNGAVVAGSDSTLTSLESSFQQDLNGDGVMPGSTSIEAFGSTQLTQLAGNYYVYTGGSGVTIKYAGSPITQGQFGSWTLIGAEQTAGGYSVVLKLGSADQYTIWSIDSSGNYLSNGAVVAGSDSALAALEASFQQDLNGDGIVPGSTVIEALGSTQLTKIGSGYYLSTGGADLSIKYAGSPIAQGQFGIWTPIGAEHTASGYTVVMKFGTADQYTIWSTDSYGNYLSNGAVVAGSDTSVTSLENSFQQDLNGDGTISSSGATIAGSGAMAVGQPAEALHHETPPFGFAQFISEQDFGGWGFIARSGEAGISELRGFSSDRMSGQPLTELLKDVQQNPTFATADGAHDTLVNHDSVGILAKAFAADLHTGFLIIH